MPPDSIFELPPAGIFLSVLGVTAAIAVALHVLMTLTPMRRFGERLADLSPVVMTLCGTLFVLSVTFLANSVWQSEDKARETVNAEARSLRVMEVYMAAMTGPARDGLAQLITDYARGVSEEWPTMRTSGGSRNAETRLNEIYGAIIRGFAEGEQNRLMQQRMLASLDQLSAARQQRLSMAQDIVSGGQWFLVTALGLLLLCIIALGHARFPVPRAVALAAITLSISIALSVIVSHDRPFVGRMALTPQPILAAAGVSG